MLKITFLLLACWASISLGRLTISGRDFYYNGQKVFLSGANIAWNSYGYDFGNGAYEANSKATLENWLTRIANNGGNSIRFWLHVEGDNTPNYDDNGYVTSLDRTGTMIDEMRSFLDFAFSKNILVVFALWNGAVLKNQNTINLLYEEDKLQSYIDNALKPMVAALGDHPAIGAWEIMNEPEGFIVANETDSNPCFDTNILLNTGTAWTGLSIPMRNSLKFINWQISAIKEVNSASLVSLGSWSEHSQNDVFEQSRNYYTDTCLVAGGGKPLGTIDFYQIHTYTNTGQWNPSGPFKVTASDYQLDKPLVIGEFASVCGGGEDVPTLFQYSYDNGYQGVWSWSYNGGETGSYCCDNQTSQDNGMARLQGLNGPGGIVNFPLKI